MKGLYFYKLTSPYPEDITKDYKLTVNEIDHNFLTLKNTDIVDIQFDNETGLLTLSQIDGKKIVTQLDLSHFTKDFSVEWDKENAILTFNYNGQVVKVDDILSQVIDNSVSNIINTIISQTITDNTIKGTGVGSDPLGINPLELTGKFRAVECIINKLEGEKLPLGEELESGTRFITYEKNNIYGYLYNYDAVVEINNKLPNGWRVPTKADWDDTLNAIEDCEGCHNHNTEGTDFYGNIAGKLLKSRYYWEEAKGIINEDGLQESPNTYEGTDNYGMCLLPSGHYSPIHGHDGVGKFAEFWTLSEDAYNDVWGKCFFYNSNKVKQVAIDKEDAYCSLRLVKDYDGQNFSGVEVINGVSYVTKLIPSENTKLGHSIWIASNYVDDNIQVKDGVYHIEQEDININKTSYYINEWDGFKWSKKELVEGDSLVIKNGPDGEYYHEYMLLDGVFVSIKKELRDEVLRGIGDVVQNINMLDTNLNKLSGEVQTNFENVDNYVKTKFEIIAHSLNNLNDRTKEHEDFDASIQKTLDEIDKRIIDNYTLLNNSIQSNTKRLVSQSGSTYDCANGVLTLKTDDPTKIITIQLTGDYGTF